MQSINDFTRNLKLMQNLKSTPGVNKSYLRYSADIVGQDQLFIVKTQVDANAANANGFPAVAFENYEQTDKDSQQDLIQISKQAKLVYIVMDEFASEQIGQIGAMLALEGISVFIVVIPDVNFIVGNNLDQYLSENGADKFREIVNKSVSLLDSVIDSLPNNFQKAAPVISEKIAPLLQKLDEVSKKHFIGLIAKRVKTTPKIVIQLLAGTIPKHDESVVLEEEQFSQEIMDKATELSRDPYLFKRRIDSVNHAGVVGERKNIAVIFCTLDSRLLQDRGAPGQNVIATKIAGHQGSGKSYTLMMSLEFYPKSAYLLITSGSERSLYYLKQGVKHKCLIVAEAYQFSASRGDSEIAYVVRTLLSEGKLNRITTVKDENGEMVSKENYLEGPVSFITTTIESGLEVQLEDRLFTIHPDESIGQTKRIVENRAKQISANCYMQNDDDIQLWKAFHTKLEPVTVVIPFAMDIAEHLNRCTVLPINARRAFNKMLNIIQAVTCVYQFQREQDDAGNLIATMADYYMALQIVYESFKENLGQLSKGTDLKLAYISSAGQVSAKNLAAHFGISRSAISTWGKQLEDEGVLKWVDDKGVDFPDDKTMSTAKRSGKAYIKLNEQSLNPWSALGLPSPLELTLAQSWRTGGTDYERFDLKLDIVTTPAQIVPASTLPDIFQQEEDINMF